jgi:hypothetical protein
MNKNISPVLDKKEIALFDRLTKDYERFIAPGPITKGLKKIQESINWLTPPKVKTLAKDSIDAAKQWQVIELVMKQVGSGFSELTTLTARITVRRESILNSFKKEGYRFSSIEEICFARSYHAEKYVERGKFQNMALALGEGMVTGAPGLIGVPFNIALSFFLYFRATQNIAMHYGYDVHNDPSELQFAADVTMASLEPSILDKEGTVTGIIAKMMLSVELSSLSHGLGRRTLSQMAERGGTELIYVQIRAMANKAAQKALNKTSSKSIEAGIFKNLLEQIGKMIPKEATKKSIPFIGAIIGGGCDSYLMSRVLYGSNLIYHKRFLTEKASRIAILDK